MFWSDGAIASIRDGHVGEAHLRDTSEETARKEALMETLDEKQHSLPRIICRLRDQRIVTELGAAFRPMPGWNLKT
jgi:hypothetical protein